MVPLASWQHNDIKVELFLNCFLYSVVGEKENFGTQPCFQLQHVCFNLFFISVLMTL